MLAGVWPSPGPSCYAPAHKHMGWLAPRLCNLPSPRARLRAVLHPPACRRQAHHTLACARGPPWSRCHDRGRAAGCACACASWQCDCLPLTCAWATSARGGASCHLSVEVSAAGPHPAGQPAAHAVGLHASVWFHAPGNRTVAHVRPHGRPRDDCLPSSSHLGMRRDPLAAAVRHLCASWLGWCIRWASSVGRMAQI